MIVASSIPTSLVADNVSVWAHVDTIVLLRRKVLTLKAVVELYESVPARPFIGVLSFTFTGNDSVSVCNTRDLCYCM